MTHNGWRHKPLGLRTAILSTIEKIWSGAGTFRKPLNPNGLLPHVAMR